MPANLVLKYLLALDQYVVKTLENGTYPDVETTRILILSSHSFNTCRYIVCYNTNSCAFLFHFVIICISMVLSFS